MAHPATAETTFCQAPGSFFGADAEAVGVEVHGDWCWAGTGGGHGCGPEMARGTSGAGAAWGRGVGAVGWGAWCFSCSARRHMPRSLQRAANSTIVVG